MEVMSLRGDMCEVVMIVESKDVLDLRARKVIGMPFSCFFEAK